mmetsp:Transcript_63127/g.137207  ORF Transcript_63127/g.137207 Transcript_63127/m.137207 type:complete len:228 (+) Transcript_63127:943-1626(+)
MSSSFVSTRLWPNRLRVLPASRPSRQCHQTTSSVAIAPCACRFSRPPTPWQRCRVGTASTGAASQGGWLSAAVRAHFVVLRRSRPLRRSRRPRPEPGSAWAAWQPRWHGPLRRKYGDKVDAWRLYKRSRPGWDPRESASSFPWFARRAIITLQRLVAVLSPEWLSVGSIALTQVHSHTVIIHRACKVPGSDSLSRAPISKQKKRLFSAVKGASCQVQLACGSLCCLA